MSEPTDFNKAASRALDALPKQQSRSLATQTTQLPTSLQPASRDQFRTELTSCLILTAPSGMTKEDRNEWLKVAWGTLRDLPPDILAAGCKVARETCDHPSKIVPTIMKEAGPWLEMRRRGARYVESPVTPTEWQLEKPDYITPEQMAEIRKEFGI